MVEALAELVVAAVEGIAETVTAVAESTSAVLEGGGEVAVGMIEVTDRSSGDRAPAARRASGFAGLPKFPG